MEFTTAGGLSRWRCTDVGARVVIAIEIVSGKDPSWYNGPPSRMIYLWLPFMPPF
jgi:hypothetical protein